MNTPGVQDAYTRCMLNDASHLKVLAHLDAPYNSLPAFDQLILPNSATTSICDRHTENLHVLVILTQPHLFKIRNAIRDTYANFPFTDANERMEKGNWTRMFLTGKPKNSHQYDLLEEENNQFGDVVIANSPDGYYSFPTLKMLIALKFAACYCPNASYFVKTDDDTYLNIGYLYQHIRQVRAQVDAESPQAKTRAANATSLNCISRQSHILKEKFLILLSKK